MKPIKLFLIHKYDSKAASFRYRLEQYLPYLQQAGFEYTVSTLLDSRYFANRFSNKRRDYLLIFKLYLKQLYSIRKALKSDLIILYGEIFPYFPAVAEFIFRLFKVPYIYDFDDAIFHYYDQSESRFVRIALSNKIKSIIRHSKCALGGSHYLVSYAMESKVGLNHSQIELFPTVIDLNRYNKIKDYSSKSSHIFTIVWIGSPTTTLNLNILSDAFADLSKLIDYKLLLIGAEPISMPGVNLEIVPWSSETEIDLLLSSDVGIMPLIDASWNYGKCGFKLIQYMACGLPVVTSPIGENIHIIQNGVQGFKAANNQEWINTVIELHDHFELRKNMGLSGRKTVEKKYALQKTGPRLVQIIQQNLGSCNE